ncbi:MAG: C25 family cysteine peptidase [Bacteroidetes bacterium]|jgi:hypothetical protein|nr:C25 family cysteine peptidase [Bacteroidota bacterium]
MRNLFISLLLLVFASAGFAQQWHPIDQQHPSKIQQELIQSDENQVVVSFKLPGFFSTTVETPHGKEAIISVPKMVSMLETGAPDLPLYAVSAIIGDNALMEVEIVNATYTDFENFEIAPSKGNFSRDIDPATVPYTYGSMYDENSFYPANRSSLQEPYILRDYRGQVMSIYPFAYNAQTKILRVFHNLTVKMIKTGEGGANQLTRKNPQITTDKEFEHLYANHFINYGEAQNRYPVVAEEGNMIVISHGPFMEAMEPFVAWKKRIGRPIEMFDVATIGTTPAAIKAFITDYYNDNGLTHILLVGDHQHVPSYNNSSSGGYSDNYYGYLEGTDSYNEAFVGRFSAETTTHVETMVQRILTFERDLDETADWLNIGMGIARNEGAGGGHNGGEADYVHMNYIRDSLLNYTYATVHQEYDGNVPGMTNTTAADISENINNGTSIINYCNHGSQNSWSVGGYSSSNVEALTNTDRWPVIWAVACDNGKFTNGSCFAEVWTRATHNGEPAGAIGTMMSWISQPWQPPMTGQDEMVTILVEGYENNIKRTLGGNSINGSMKMVDLHGSSGRSTHDTWILFGDPSMTMRTDVPAQMTVSHPTTLFLGMQELTVNADAEDAIVTLTWEGEILASAYVEGGQAILTFPALAEVGMLDITVFGYNKVTYMSEIEVIPAEGPFIGFVGYEINDETGNNNGLIDYNENISLGLTLENLGVETANDLIATLSTESPYVSFSDDTESYGAIAAGEEMSIANAFSFEVSDDIPDMTSIAFDLVITGTDDSWEASFSINAHAPLLSIGSYSIADNSGNGNGRLDPGETADMFISFSNEGSSKAFDIVSSLIATDPLITINEATFDLAELDAATSSEAVFNLSVSASAPIGTAIELLNQLEAGAYNAEKTFVTKVGLVLEDFETGDFTAFDWVSGGNMPWTITESDTYEGTYAAESGGISDSQSTQMILEYEVSVDDSISFFRKVSSESGYDKLLFYIDNNQVGEWSGNEGWSKVAYPVNAGTRTFKWEYMKDGSVSNGDDNAMVDYIVFPASISTTGWAGNDATICQGDTYQLEGSANHYTTVEWTTSGTGTFDDATILNPVYTPGDEDITTGSVELTLIVTGESTVVESSLTLAISAMPEASAGEAGFICQGESFDIVNATALNYTDILWETSGTGSFDDATLLNPVYTPSEDDYNTGMITLSLTAIGAGSCGDAISATELSFHSLPTAMLEGDQTICEGEQAQLTFTLTGEAPWTVIMADGMGSVEIFDTPHTMMMTPDAPMTMSLLTVMDGNGCTNAGEGSATIEMMYAPLAPLAPTAPDSVDYAETTVSTITIEAVEGATAYDWAVEPAEAGTFEGEGLEVSINWNTSYIGEAQLMAKAQNDCGWSEWSPVTTVVLESTVGLQESFEKAFMLYPNPSDGEVYLSLDYAIQGKVNLSVTNSIGMLVYETELEASQLNSTVKLPLSQLEKGVYLIRITTSELHAVKPLLINK